MQHSLADALYGEIPADVGSKGSIALEAARYGAMLMGARWALEQGWGDRDLERIEGRRSGVRRAARMVSDHALDPATIISKCRQSFEVFDPGEFARRNDSGQNARQGLAL
jgi:hypothetical protein